MSRWKLPDQSHLPPHLRQRFPEGVRAILAIGAIVFLVLIPAGLVLGRLLSGNYPHG